MADELSNIIDARDRFAERREAAKANSQETREEQALNKRLWSLLIEYARTLHELRSRHPSNQHIQTYEKLKEHFDILSTHSDTAKRYSVKVRYDLGKAYSRQAELIATHRDTLYQDKVRPITGNLDRMVWKQKSSLEAAMKNYREAWLRSECEQQNDGRMRAFGIESRLEMLDLAGQHLSDLFQDTPIEELYRLHSLTEKVQDFRSHSNPELTYNQFGKKIVQACNTILHYIDTEKR